MRALKFNKYERVAGIFVLTAILGGFVTAFSVAVKQSWFATKAYYSATFENAAGLRQGTPVEISGLRAGAVESVELGSDNRIRVNFYILGKFKDRLRENSTVQLIRPFVIGERVLDLSVGDEQYAALPEHSSVTALETMDLMTLMSGKNVNSSLSKLSGALESMEILLEAFGDKNRAQNMVQILDGMGPLIKGLNQMSMEVVKVSRQASKNQGVEKLMTNLAVTTTEINRILPALNSENPHLAQDLASMSRHLAAMTRTLEPALTGIEGELPGASLRLVEALNETVVVLKAMQKSFFMKSHVEQVRHEEEQQRLPANSDK